MTGLRWFLQVNEALPLSSYERFLFNLRGLVSSPYRMLFRASPLSLVALRASKTCSTARQISFWNECGPVREHATAIGDSRISAFGPGRTWPRYSGAGHPSMLLVRNGKAIFHSKRTG